MNEQEAKERCAELAAEHPDRETHQWVPVRDKDGGWTVAKIDLPPPATPTGTATRRETLRPSDHPQGNPWLDPHSGGIT
jgi:hypothetical protein